MTQNKKQSITRPIHAKNRAKAFKMLKAVKAQTRSEYLEEFCPRPSGRATR